MSQLRAHAVDYAKYLPSLECDEHISSQQLLHGKIVRSTDAFDKLRVIRKPGADGSFEETRVVVDNSKEAGKGKGFVRPPLVLTDGFLLGQQFLLDDAKWTCLNWTLDAGGTHPQLNFRQRPPTQLAPECRKSGDGVEGMVLLDRASGQMILQRRSTSITTAVPQNLLTLGELAYAPVTFGDRTLWLPTRIYAEFGPDLRYTATYSGCQRFAASSRIVGVGSAE